MTTPASDARRPADPQRQAWARKLLDVSENASLDEIRTLLLARLDDVQRHPPRAWRQAARLAGQLDDEPIARECDDYLLAAEDGMRTQVEEYAGKFFDLPADVRRNEWTRLHAASEPYPVLRVRLQQLKPGLTTVLDRKVRDDALPVAELYGQLQQMFLLPPPQRDAQRQALLRATREAELSWAEAAKCVRTRYPDCAALDRELLLTLINRPRRRPAGAVAAKQAAAAGRSQGSGDRSWRWIALVLIGLVSGLARVASEHSSRNSPNSVPDWSTTSENLSRQVEELNRIAEQTRQYEEKQAQGQDVSGPKPPFLGEGARRLLGLPPSPAKKSVPAAKAPP